MPTYTIQCTRNKKTVEASNRENAIILAHVEETAFLHKDIQHLCSEDFIPLIKIYAIQPKNGPLNGYLFSALDHAKKNYPDEVEYDVRSELPAGHPFRND